MLTASSMHKEFFYITTSSKLLLSALLQNLFCNPYRKYFLHHLLAVVDARAEEVGDDIIPAPHLYITKELYRS